MDKYRWINTIIIGTLLLLQWFMVVESAQRVTNHDSSDRETAPEEPESSTFMIDYNRGGYNISPESQSRPSGLNDKEISGGGSRQEGLVERVEEKLDSPEALIEILDRGESKPIKLEVAPESRRNSDREEKSPVSSSHVLNKLLRKNPYSKYWPVEQKWDDVFRRVLAIEKEFRSSMAKSFLRDSEYYSDVAISQACQADLKFIQDYSKNSTNFRWLLHMVDATGKNEPGMLTGNMAALGHVIQCINVRAPARASNDTFDERFFELQAEQLGERFRGKYCLASVRPVLPERPQLVSRFANILDDQRLSNISYLGDDLTELKRRAYDMSPPEAELHEQMDRHHKRLDELPFESELYEYLIRQRNFMYSLPRFMGVCYPSSCSRDDIRLSLQKTLDEQHQVVDIEFECELAERSWWDYHSMPRLMCRVLLSLVVLISALASLIRYVLVDKLGLKRRLAKSPDTRLQALLDTLDICSMDKCAGSLFIKMRPASTKIDPSKVENLRSNSIDALRGLLMLLLLYSQLVQLGCLPVPFMWAKWADAMFPFYRSLAAQVFLNSAIWSESLYLISAYLIGTKLLENYRPRESQNFRPRKLPDLASFVVNRYVRLALPMLAFLLLNYIWPRLSNGFVMQDQASKILAPCDSHGWTNMLLFHNHQPLNETCLWPSHVGATFFQLHLLSYPILLLMLFALKTQTSASGSRQAINKILSASIWTLGGLLLALGIFYPAWQASREQLIVPFLIDYIDYDNYRRVIEWTVTPTVNHLTSYVAGLMLAYVMVRARLRSELHRPDNIQEQSASGWFTTFSSQNDSCDSTPPSSNPDKGASLTRLAITQDADYGAPSKFKLNHLPTTLESSNPGIPNASTPSLRSFLYSLFASFVIFVSLSSSFYWNGLGQEMTNNQTFWFVSLNKLIFLVCFSYLFGKHFATRKNSTSPWMITRFLVPIGRMSLSFYYVGWLATWFDLLSSLNQWHPSHYFISEKYAEIVVMALILAMLIYGSFEGTVRRLAYKQITHRLTRRLAQGSSPLLDAFDGLFVDERFQGEAQLALSPISAQTSHSTHRDNYTTESTAKPATIHTGLSSKLFTAPTAGLAKTGPGQTQSSDRRQQVTKHQLSTVERSQLNAELRANTSFASMTLYESAGATGDLHYTQDSPRPSIGFRRRA